MTAQQTGRDAGQADGAAAWRIVVLVGALVALVVAVVGSLGVGAHPVTPSEVVRALVASDGSSEHVTVHEIRAPRTLLAIAVGAALATAGTLIQTLSRNPLAEPGILGVTTGAGFAITVGAALGLATSQAGTLGVAMVGAVLAAIAVYVVGRRSPLHLVLAGVALSAVLSGISLGMRLMLPDVFDQYRFWSVGSLAGREQTPLVLPLVAIGLSLAGALLVSRALNVVALGETVARALGTNIVWIRFTSLVLITVLTGAAVAGPILFVGLIVPHLARRMAAGTVPWLVTYSIVLGPVLLLVSDTIARVLLSTGEVPVAVVTAFLGGPMLIWAVRRYGTVPL